MKKKNLQTRIDLVLSPQRGSEKQLGKIASMAVYFKCLYVTLWKYKITSWNFFYVYDIMLYTCTRVEYTCSIDAKDTAAYNSAHQKI